MSQFNLDPNKKITKGKSAPVDRSLSGLEVKKLKGVTTNLKEIDWTKRKLLLVTTALIIPYIAAVLFMFIARITLGVYFLVGIAIFVIFLVVILRFVDRQDF